MSVKPEYKIIADHLRSSCFIIADGALPSNEGRGYVLRRIMRRAMRQLHKLGAREASMYKFVDALIEEMGAAYPELVRAREVIIEVLRNEEEKFRETLEKGLKILEEEIVKISAAIKPTPLSGAVAFKLYDTYGFPLDLTQDILKEKNIKIDIDGFHKEMELQRERARANWKGSGEEKENTQLLELKNKFGATKFLGYETLEAKTKIIAISFNGKLVDEASDELLNFSDENLSHVAPNGLEKQLPNSCAEKNIFIILDQTSFYATSGGQKGDEGFIKNSKNKMEIFATEKNSGGIFLHYTNNIKGKFKVGDEVVAQVNSRTRQSRSCNHSATHLMHKALKEVLGNSISQKGSNVDADYFTFDFNFNRAMTPEEKLKVENLVNQYIAHNSPVKTEVMSLEKARESGAEALFGEKYDNDVRVVSMLPSVELCGGTHVRNTREIESFKLVSENGIAAGIRRITAVTSFAAVEKENKKIADAAQELARKEELKAKEKEAEKIKKQNIFAGLDKLKSENVGNIKFLHHIFEDLEAKDLRDIATEIKARKDFREMHVFVFFATKDEKVSVCIALTNDLLDKLDATKLIAPAVEIIGGKGGGGKKDLAMGGGINKDKIVQAVDLIRKLVG